jgi:hypothetical protein
MTHFSLSRIRAALVLATFSAGAAAQPVTMPTQVSDVLSFEVGGGFEYHDNIFRLEGGPSDTVLRGLLGVRFEREVSLQRFTAFANISPVKYLDFSAYDYLGYNAGLQWDWEVGRPIFGTLQANLSRDQTAFDVIGGAQNNLRDLRSFRGLVGFRLTQSMSVIAALDQLNIDNSLITQQASNFDRTGFEGGIRYAPGNALDLDFVYRREDGEFPNRQVFDANGNLLPAAVDNAFTQDTVLVRLGYRPSEATRVAGNIGYARRNFDNVPQRDFSGITGGLDAEWPLSGQVQMRASLFRTIDTADLLTSNFIDTLGFVVRPVWTLTSRVTIDGLFSYANRSYDGDPGFVFTGAPVREDRLIEFGVRVNYEFARRIFLFGDLRRLDRSSNYAGFDFVDNWFGLGVRAAF